jgi:hypothetical protein
MVSALLKVVTAIISRPARMLLGIYQFDNNLDHRRSAMASTPNPIGLEDPNVETTSLSIALRASSLSDVEHPPQHGAEKTQTDSSTNRPLRIYSRAQLLNLHRSPLVQPPPDMPELKMWFG